MSRGDQDLHPPPEGGGALKPVSPEVGEPSVHNAARQIGHRAARGAMLASAQTALINVIQLASSILLARKLIPDEYGAFALGATIVGFGRYLGDCGAGNAVIQMPGGDRTVDHAQLGRVFTIQLWTTGVCAVLLASFSPLIADGFDAAPHTAAIIAVMACTLVIDAPSVVPRVRMRRGLHYERLLRAEMGSALVGYAVQIGALLLGFGVWSLVLNQVIGAVALTGFTLIAGGGTVKPVRHGALALAKRGLSFQYAFMMQAAFTVLSVVVAAKLLGKTDLGLWQWSTVFATPLIGVAQMIHTVSFPALARLHEENESHFRSAVGLVARLITVFVSVVAGVLAGFARPLVVYIYDPKWERAIPAARVALLGVVPLALSFLWAASLESAGRPHARVRATVVAVIVGFVVTFPFGGLWAATGASLAISVVVPVIDFWLLQRSLRAPIRRAAVDGLMTGGLSFAVSLAIADHVHSFKGLLAAGPITALVCVGLAFLVDPQAIKRGVKFARSR